MCADKQHQRIPRAPRGRHLRRERRKSRRKRPGLSLGTQVRASPPMHAQGTGKRKARIMPAVSSTGPTASPRGPGHPEHLTVRKRGELWVSWCRQSRLRTVDPPARPSKAVTRGRAERAQGPSLCCTDGDLGAVDVRIGLARRLELLCEDGTRGFHQTA